MKIKIEFTFGIFGGEWSQIEEFDKNDDLYFNIAEYQHEICCDGFTYCKGWRFL